MFRIEHELRHGGVYPPSQLVHPATMCRTGKTGGTPVVTPSTSHALIWFGEQAAS